MALFKVLRGSETNLDSQELHDGYAYFTQDTNNFYIDHEKDGQLIRSLSGVGKNTIEGGEVFNSNTNIANTINAHAEGGKTKAGGRGYKILASSPNGDGTGTYTLSSTSGLSGDSTMEYSIRLSSALYKVGVITAINDNTITVTNYSSISPETEADDPDNYSVENYLTIVGRPDLGDTDIGFNAHAEGEDTVAQDRDAHAEGRQTKAIGQYGHAEGRQTIAAYAAHAEGRNTQAIGDMSHSEGSGSQATGRISHAEGNGTVASGAHAHAEGSGTTASGEQAHAEGASTKAIGKSSHTEGRETFSYGEAGHAEGFNTTVQASGTYAHAEGANTVSSGLAAHAEGNGSVASGEASHAEGISSTASGMYSHAEGHNNFTKGYAAHVEGSRNEANGPYSHVEGVGNISNQAFQHVQGTNIEEDTEGKYAHIQGGQGIYSGRYFNIHTVDWDGNAWFSGDVTVGQDKDILATEKQVDTKIKESTADWNETNEANNSYIKNKISIANGQGKNSLEIMQGEATGDYSIAGGTIDDALLEGIAGSTASFVKDLEKAKATGNMTMAFGADSEASADGAITIGIGNNVGAKGYYWHSIDFANNKITLSTTRPTTLSSSIKAPTSLDWQVGDYICIFNSYSYNCLSRITNISNNTITVDSLPFTNNTYDTTKTILGNTVTIYPATYTVPEDRTIVALYEEEYILSKKRWMSRNGTVNIGFGALSLGALNTVTGRLANATGMNNLASGIYAEASGLSTKALGDISHTEGNNTRTEQEAAHAEGYYTTARGKNSHAEGNNTLASGDNSHVEGYLSTATNINAHAEGYYCEAKGNSSHAEGSQSIAHNEASHAEGKSSEAQGAYAHAEGYYTIAEGEYAHSEGNQTHAEASGSHAEGGACWAKGIYSHAEGQDTEAQGIGSHAEGRGTHAIGAQGHAEGYLTYANNFASHAEGNSSTANGDASHVEGVNNHTHCEGQHVQGRHAIPDAEGKYAHIVGNGIWGSPRNIHTLDWDGNAWFANNITIGDERSTVVTEKAQVGRKLGGGEIFNNYQENIARGSCSHAEGGKTQGLGNNSHAEGYQSIAEADTSHAEGNACWTTGFASHAEGNMTYAKGEGSHSEGVNNRANGTGQHVQGRHAVEDINSEYAHIVGNGNWGSPRNIHTLDWNGNAWFEGNITVGKDKKPIATTDELIGFSKIITIPAEPVELSAANGDEAPTEKFYYYTESPDSIFLSFNSYSKDLYDVEIRSVGVGLQINNVKQNAKNFSKLQLLGHETDNQFMVTGNLPYEDLTVVITVTPRRNIINKEEYM